MPGGGVEWPTPARMTFSLSRRSLLRAVAAAPLALTASRRLTWAQQAAGPAPNNVWAATTGPILDALADLPPRVYVPHENGGDIAVIDPLSRQIVDRYRVGRTPHHVTPAYDLSRLYVNVMGAGRLVEIDIQTGRPARSIPVPAPYNLYFALDGSLAIVAAEPFNRLDFSADGSYLLVSAEFSGHLARVDVGQMALSGVVSVGGLPIDVKLAPEGDLF